MVHEGDKTRVIHAWYTRDDWLMLRWAAVGLSQLLGGTRSCRVVMPAVATDDDTPAGWCPLTHTQLQVVRLSADERLAMRTALYQLAEEKVTANSARRGSKVITTQTSERLSG